MTANVLTVSLRLHILGDVTVDRAHGFTEASMEYDSQPSALCEVEGDVGLSYTMQQGPAESPGTQQSDALHTGSFQSALLCHSTGLFANITLSLMVIGSPIKPYSDFKTSEPRRWHSHLLAHV